MIRQQRIGFLFLTGAILIIELYLHRDFLFAKNIEIQELPLSIAEQLSNSNSEKKKSDRTLLQPFNPNDYSREDWKRIGFSEKQVDVILKYKNKLGGTFTSKEEIKACFVISEEKYQELSAFLLLPKNNHSHNQQEAIFHLSDKKYQLRKFDPNDYTLSDWKNIGFSDKQAEIILKYKSSVGGRFTSKEQLKKCFVISEKKYMELAPYIHFSQLIEQKKDKEVRITPTAKKELNTASFNDISAIIKDASVAGRLIGFRKGLGGFVSKEQIKDVYGITPEMLAVLLESFTLDVSKIHKISLEKASESDLQAHIYLRKYKNKIMEARAKGEVPLKVIPKSDSKYNYILLYLE